MNEPNDRLYALLPALYRIRDRDLVGPDGSPPLRSLLRVIAEQVQRADDDVAQMYDDWFIETCAPWVVPYLADLIGYQTVYEHASTFTLGDDPKRREARARAIVSRREVARTVAFRRRKGTAALLGALAEAAGGWPAVAVETYQRLGVTQSMRHLRLDRGALCDVRDELGLDRSGGAFDTAAHSVDVRRPSAAFLRGRHNIPAVALFAWRLKPRAVTQTSACCIEEIGPNCFTFNVLGHDTQLFTRPDPDEAGARSPRAVPAPISRRGLAERGAYYGSGKSLTLWASDWPKKGVSAPIDPAAVIAADLSDWGPPPARNQVAIDPVLGRIVFPASQYPKAGLRVTYHDALSADIGGGEYARAPAQPAGSTLLRVGASEALKTIRAALERWAQIKAEARAAAEKANAEGRQAPSFVPSAVIELVDNGVYTEPLNLSLEAGEVLQLRSAEGTRAVLRLLDYMADRPDAFSVGATGAGARLVLDGLLIAGRGLQVDGRSHDAEDTGVSLCAVIIRDCTLVPGWLLDCACTPRRPNEPSIELRNTDVTLRIERSIVGSVLVSADAQHTEPARIEVQDSVIDATSHARVAIGSSEAAVAHALVRIARSTVFGGVRAHAIEAAENSLFTGCVFVARRQIGCMRFCYLRPGSRAPVRFHCQPETAVFGDLEKARAATPSLSEAEEARIRSEAESRVEPVFESTRFGSPRYAQLSELCDEAIAAGADDGAELGVFHDLYQPQRLTNLRTRLAEYTPAGMDVGVFFAT